jgi:glycosyltransferase involved in cell wall biosynthesis
MKVAWVTPYLPEPAASGGAIRQQRLAAALATHADVHLFARGEPWERRRLRSSELAVFASRWLGRDYWPSSRPTSSRRIRRGSSAALYRAVAALHRKIGLDLLVVAHSWGSCGAPDLGLPWLLDEHNVESHYFAELNRSENRSGQGVERELRELVRWERHVWTSATALTCVSEADASLMAEHRSKAGDPALREPLVVPNGVDMSRVPTRHPREGLGGVLFVGSMHHRPNVDAALRLVEGILPRVWRELPDASLTIVGGPVPSELLAPRARLEARRAALVRLLGVVPSVQPHLAEARVFANPVRHGAGSSLKIAEALGAGIPIVSSDVGVRGFGLVPGRHYLSANSDEEQALAIVRVLRDPELAAALSHEARQEAERYDWAVLGSRFVAHALRAAQKQSR